MRRTTLLAALVLLLSAAAAFSQIQAVVNDFRGKVEVMVAGGSWTAVTKGMVIQPGTTISTGFNSTAVLKMGLSTVTVQQLTRMTLQQLVEDQGKVTTSLGLPIGRIQAQVRSPAGGSADFQVQSSVSTAAVRGTEFDYDGYHLVVSEGVVALFNKLRQLRLVAAGEESHADGTDLPTGGEDEHNQSSGTEGGQGGSGGSPETHATGTIVVELK